MRWFRYMKSDRGNRNPLITNAFDLGGLEDWHFRAGVPVSNWGPGRWVGATLSRLDGDPDDALQDHLSIPIWSSRIRRALEELGANGIQWLPIDVRRPNGRSIEGYSVANVLTRDGAIDQERTGEIGRYANDYFIPEERGAICYIKRAALRGEALGDIDAFRPSEYRVILFVSERVKAVFDGFRSTGAEFAEVPVT